MNRRKPPPPDPFATAVRRRPSLDFSLTGLVYCSMMMFMGLAAINTQANLLFGVFGLMIGILLVSGVISRLVLRRLDVARRLPEHATVGRAVRLEYLVTNRKAFWPSLSVTLAELEGVEAFTRQPHAYLLHAAARTTATVPAELVAKRRGLHRFGRYQVSTSFPFGFIKRATNRTAADTILIYPALAPVDRRLMNRFRSSRAGGADSRPREGGGDEFFGVRDYRPGDNPRRIYWRRSAARAGLAVAGRTGPAGGSRPGGGLVIKEMTHVAPPRLLVAVDTHAPAGATDVQLGDVERAISMAASLVSDALAAGLPVGLFAWGREDAAGDEPPGWLHLPDNRGKRHRRDLLTALAALPRNADRPLDELRDAARRHAAGRSAEGTTLVVFTPGAGSGPSSLAEAARATSRGGAEVVLGANDPQARGYFKFDPDLDFAHAGPVG